MSLHICESTSCEKPAKLQCPNCVKLGIDSFFCSQVCEEFANLAIELKAYLKVKFDFRNVSKSTGANTKKCIKRIVCQFLNNF